MFSRVTISSINSQICNASEEGNIYAWDTSKWMYDMNCKKSISNINIINPLVIFLPLKENIEDAYETCKRIGNGTIAEFQNKTEWQELFNYYKKDWEDLDYIHFPYFQIDNTTLLSFYNEEKIPNTQWANCQTYSEGYNLLAVSNESCISYEYHSRKPYYYFCNFSSVPVNKLAGLQKLGQQNQFYYLSMHHKKPGWSDFNSSSIKFIKNMWRTKIYGSAICMGSKAPLDSFLLAKNLWEAYNVGSFKNETIFVNLSMHSYPSEEFVCNDGTCTKYEERCDGTFNCKDNSDEAECNFVKFSEDYNKEIVVPEWLEKKVNLTINLHLLEVLDIKINDGKLNLKVNVTATWFDQRLKYVYLNADVSLNVLGSADFDLIWKPNLIYANKDTNPNFFNVEPEVSVSLDNPLDYGVIIDEVSGAETKTYYGSINLLSWSAVIR
jgi:hypothetical protein